MKHIKPYNESIRKYLKPKSEEDILKNIDNWDDDEKATKACEYNVTWLIQSLFDQGFDPNAEIYNNGDYLINYAIKYNSIDVIKVFLKNDKFDPTINDNFLLKISCEKGWFDIVQLLLENKRVNPACDRNYPIRLAMKYKRDNIVKLLLTNKHVRRNMWKVKLLEPKNLSYKDIIDDRYLW